MASVGLPPIKEAAVKRQSSERLHPRGLDLRSRRTRAMMNEPALQRFFGELTKRAWQVALRVSLSYTTSPPEEDSLEGGVGIGGRSRKTPFAREKIEALHGRTHRLQSHPNPYAGRTTSLRFRQSRRA